VKPAAILVLILCLAAVGGLVFLYLQSTVTVTALECVAVDAVNQLEAFEALRAQLASDTFTGTRFTRDLPEKPEDYLFYTYTVRADNRAMLPAELLELQVTPMAGDVLQIGDLEPHDLPSGQSASLTATILSPREGHNVRELTVTYYIWGIPFSVRLTSRGTAELPVNCLPRFCAARP